MRVRGRNDVVVADDAIRCQLGCCGSAVLQAVLMEDNARRR